MAEALFPDEAYRDQLLALMPRGRVWPKAPGSPQHGLASGLAPTFGRLDARAQQLLFDAFPANTVELLLEWEWTLGLPDPCEGEDQTLEQRRAQVLARLTVGGGQSKAYYLQVLATLGYADASITEYAPFRADHSVANSPLYSEDWWYVWTINLPGLRAFYFEADISAAGEALLTVANDSVFCVIAAIKPAHTIALYTFDPA